MITVAKNINKRITTLLLSSFSHKNSLINQTPANYVDQRTALKDNIWRTPDPTHLKSAETHLSNAEYLVNKVPVIYTDQHVVRCMGGVEIGPGHPQVYLQLDTRKAGEPVACKYCGLRFALRHHH